MIDGQYQKESRTFVQTYLSTILLSSLNLSGCVWLSQTFEGIITAEWPFSWLSAFASWWSSRTWFGEHFGIFFELAEPIGVTAPHLVHMRKQGYATLLHSPHQSIQLRENAYETFDSFIQLLCASAVCDFDDVATYVFDRRQSWH